MLQQKIPKDYVIATGRTETVRKFIEICAENLNWNPSKNGPSIIWEGEGINEIGRRPDTNQIVIRIDPRYFRPTEVDILIGDPSKAKKELGWEPKISLDDLIKEMICEDLKKVKEELVLKEKGFDIFSSTESPLAIQIRIMEKLIKKNDRIFLAGANGMVGSSIKRILKNKGYGQKNKIF